MKPKFVFIIFSVVITMLLLYGNRDYFIPTPLFSKIDRSQQLNVDYIEVLVSKNFTRRVKIIDDIETLKKFSDILSQISVKRVGKIDEFCIDKSEASYDIRLYSIKNKEYVDFIPFRISKNSVYVILDSTERYVVMEGDISKVIALCN